MTIVQSFTKEFQLLPQSTQKVFKCLQQLSREFLHVLTTHEEIANNCKIGKRTVSRAINYMKKNGWIAVKKRPYQSNLYFMPNELIAVNLSDPSLFKRQGNETVKTLIQ